MPINGEDKRKYGKLKEDLANNYLLGTNQYPDTFKKAVGIVLPSGHKQQQVEWHSSNEEDAELGKQQAKEGGCEHCRK